MIRIVQWLIKKKKIVLFALPFILLMFSSWLSVESILLSWVCVKPLKWLLYLLTMAIYLIAATCLKCTIISLDRYEYVYARGRKFILGLLGWIVLWFGFIIPTKTHTLVYKQTSAITIQETANITGYDNICIFNNDEQHFYRMENVYSFWKNLLNGHFKITGYTTWLRMLLSVVIDVVLFTIFVYPAIRTIRLNRRRLSY